MGKWIVGNWKMNGSTALVDSFVPELLDGLRKLPPGDDHVVGLCPPFPYLARMAERLAGSTVRWGAQNVSPHPDGAFTGEVSTAMLVDLGAQLCLIGHSERRQHYGETDGSVQAKLQALLGTSLTPIVCVGETLEQRQAGRQEAVVGGQLQAALSGVTGEQAGRVVIAYEPVWAIGTGHTATPEQAEAMHGFIRGVLEETAGRASAGHMPILYGGSVNPENAGSLLAQPNIDGALVGGASLKAPSFLGIINRING